MSQRGLRLLAWRRESTLSELHLIGSARGRTGLQMHQPKRRLEPPTVARFGEAGSDPRWRRRRAAQVPGPRLRVERMCSLTSSGWGGRSYPLATVSNAARDRMMRTMVLTRLICCTSIASIPFGLLLTDLASAMVTRQGSGSHRIGGKFAPAHVHIIPHSNDRLNVWPACLLVVGRSQIAVALCAPDPDQTTLHAKDAY
jgi:hypothetical protein